MDQTVQEKYINGSSLHGKAWDYVQSQVQLFMALIYRQLSEDIKMENYNNNCYC